MDYKDVDHLFTSEDVSEIRLALLETSRKTESANLELSQLLSNGANDLLAVNSTANEQHNALKHVLSSLTVLIQETRSASIADSQDKLGSTVEQKGTTKRFHLASLLQQDSIRLIAVPSRQPWSNMAAVSYGVASCLATLSVDRQGSDSPALASSLASIGSILSQQLGKHCVSTLSSAEQSPLELSGVLATLPDAVGSSIGIAALSACASGHEIASSGTTPPQCAVAAAQAIEAAVRSIADCFIARAAAYLRPSPSIETRGTRRPPASGGNQLTGVAGVQAACTAWEAGVILMAAPCIALQGRSQQPGGQTPSVVEWACSQVIDSAGRLLLSRATGLSGGQPGVLLPVSLVRELQAIDVSGGGGAAGSSSSSLFQSLRASAAQAARGIPEAVRLEAGRVCRELGQTVGACVEGHLAQLCEFNVSSGSVGETMALTVTTLRQGELPGMSAIAPLVRMMDISPSHPQIAAENHGSEDPEARAALQRDVPLDGCLTRCMSAGVRSTVEQMHECMGLPVTEREVLPMPSKEQSRVTWSSCVREALDALHCSADGSVCAWVAPALTASLGRLVAADACRLRAVVRGLVRRVTTVLNKEQRVEPRMRSVTSTYREHGGMSSSCKHRRIRLTLSGEGSRPNPYVGDPGAAWFTFGRHQLHEGSVAETWLGRGRGHIAEAGVTLVRVVERSTSTLRALLKACGRSDQGKYTDVFLNAAADGMAEAIREHLHRHLMMEQAQHRQTPISDRGTGIAGGGRVSLELAQIGLQLDATAAWSHLQGDGASQGKATTPVASDAKQALREAIAAAVMHWAETVAGGLVSYWSIALQRRPWQAGEEAWCFGRQGGLPWLAVGASNGSSEGDGEGGSGSGSGSEGTHGKDDMVCDSEDAKLDSESESVLVPCGPLPESRWLHDATARTLQAIAGWLGVRGAAETNEQHDNLEPVWALVLASMALRRSVELHAAAAVVELTHRHPALREARRERAADGDEGEGDVLGNAAVFPAPVAEGASIEETNSHVQPQVSASNAAICQLVFDSGWLGLLLGGGRGARGSTVVDLWAPRGMWEASRLRAAAASMTVSGGESSGQDGSRVQWVGAAAAIHGLAESQRASSSTRENTLCTGPSAGIAEARQVALALAEGEHGVTSASSAQDASPWAVAKQWASRRSIRESATSEEKVHASVTPEADEGTAFPVLSLCDVEHALAELIDPVDWSLTSDAVSDSLHCAAAGEVLRLVSDRCAQRDAVALHAGEDAKPVGSSAPRIGLLLGAAAAVQVRYVAARRHRQRWHAALAVPSRIFRRQHGDGTAHSTVTYRALGACRRALPVAVGFEASVRADAETEGEGDATEAGEHKGRDRNMRPATAVGAGMSHAAASTRADLPNNSSHRQATGFSSMFGGVASSIFG